jgi:hypothetical protein
MSVACFSTATAEKFGINERHARRLVAVESKLAAPDVALLRAAPKAICLKDLSDLSKVGNGADRYEVIAGFSADRFKKIYAAGVTLSADLQAKILKVSGGSIRHVSTNLARAVEAALSRGLRTFTLADWGAEHWNSSQPPEARQLRLSGEITRRRGVAA